MQMSKVFSWRGLGFSHVAEKMKVLANCGKELFSLMQFYMNDTHSSCIMSGINTVSLGIAISMLDRRITLPIRHQCRINGKSYD